MSVFEDLIEELKEANLLEETVIESSSKKEFEFFETEQIPNESSDLIEEKVIKKETGQIDSSAAMENESANAIGAAKLPSAKPAPAEIKGEPAGIIARPKEKKAEPVDEIEFFRRRATEEVTCLQMVEHIFSGVERDQLKIIPQKFDDLEVKKALHNFIQLAGEVDAGDHAQAEFKLMQETEGWFSALTHRDRTLSVGHLRRFCETTRPALSSQALISLARFYRNAPFNEAVRSKFDLVITRLFSKEAKNDTRDLLLTRDQIIQRLNQLYSEWSSVPLYDTEDDNSEILIAALKFEELIAEADEAADFDDLVKNGFFNRLRSAKEDTYENFFAPLVAATAIEANVRIGNRYVELLERERESEPSSEFEEKYGHLHELEVSEVTGKSLLLAERLREKNEPEAVAVEPVEEPEPKKIEEVEVSAGPPVVKTEKKKKAQLKINKKLLVLTVATVIVGVVFYFGGFGQEERAVQSADVKRVNLENSSLREHIQTARTSNEIFYGVVGPSWSKLTQNEKENFLRKILSVGRESEFNKVHLFNNEGKTVGFGSADKIEAFNP